MWRMICNKINDGSMRGLSQVLWSKLKTKRWLCEGRGGGKLGHNCEEMVEYIVWEKQGEDNIGRWSSEFPDIVEEVENEP